MSRTALSAFPVVKEEQTPRREESEKIEKKKSQGVNSATLVLIGGKGRENGKDEPNTRKTAVHGDREEEEGEDDPTGIGSPGSDGGGKSKESGAGGGVLDPDETGDDDEEEDGRQESCAEEEESYAEEEEEGEKKVKRESRKRKRTPPAVASKKKRETSAAAAAAKKKKQKKKKPIEQRVWFRELSSDDLDTETCTKKFLLSYARKLIDDVYGFGQHGHQ